MSPFLFCLAMEGLSKMLEQARQLQWIQGFRVGTNDDNSASVSHLLYADDTFVFNEVKKLQMQYLKVTGLLFEAISGVHINTTTRQKVLSFLLMRWQLWTNWLELWVVV